MQQVLCLACASVFQSDKEKVHACPECGYAISDDVFNELKRYATIAMRFGYVYRKTYEREFASGGHRKAYLLAELHTSLQFLGIVALSGIIGNASYDLLKRAVKKLSQAFANVDVRSTQDLLEAELSDAELRRLMHYVEDFVKENEFDPPEIFDLCKMEFMTEPLGLELLAIGRQEAKSEDEKLQKAREWIQLKKKERSPPSSDALTNCWSNLVREEKRLKGSKRKKKKRTSNRRPMKNRRGKNKRNRKKSKKKRGRS